ncbi:MAG: hypothetical protein NC489_14225 [Ruminococcus flavefaciens]|nr:hypothetical protein [Ruminococcus flavefaciens]
MVRVEKYKWLCIGQAGVIVDKCLWGSDANENGLYKIDLQSLKINFVNEFPVECESLCFSCVLEKDKKLYFVPYHASELVIYDIKTDMFEKIEIKNHTEEKYIIGLFGGEVLYLFPDVGERIAKIDIRDNIVTYDYEVINEVKEKCCMEGKEFFNCGYEKNGVFYLPLWEDNVLVSYDWRNMIINYYDLSFHENSGFYTYAIRDEEILLLSRYGCVYSFNTLTEEKNIIYIPTDKRKTKDGYCDIALFKNEIWLIPFLKEEILIYDIYTKQQTVLNEYPETYSVCETTSVDNVAAKFSKAFISEGKLWLCPWRTNLLISIDLDTKVMKGISALKPDCKQYRLKEYIKFLQQQERIRKYEEAGKIEFGSKIWNKLKMDWFCL